MLGGLSDKQETVEHRSVFFFADCSRFVVVSSHTLMEKRKFWREMTDFPFFSGHVGFRRRSSVYVFPCFSAFDDFPCGVEVVPEDKL